MKKLLFLALFASSFVGFLKGVKDMSHCDSQLTSCHTRCRYAYLNGGSSIPCNHACDMGYSYCMNPNYQ